MKFVKMTLASALVLGVGAAWAAKLPDVVTFEPNGTAEYVIEDGDEGYSLNAGNGSLRHDWLGDDGDSLVVRYKEPVEGNTQYLKIDNTGELYRTVDQDDIGRETVIETKVQFTASDDAPAVNTEVGGEKLVVWTKAMDEGNPVLCVTAADWSTGNVAPTVYVTDIEVVNDTWHSLKIVATKSKVGDANILIVDVPMFKVYLDNNEVSGKAEGSNEEVSTFASIQTGTQIVSVGFKGTGAIDDYSVTQTTLSTVAFTLSYGDNITVDDIAVVFNEDDEKEGDARFSTTANEGDTYLVEFPAAEGYHFEEGEGYTVSEIDGISWASFEGTVATSAIEIVAPTAVPNAASLTVYEQLVADLADTEMATVALTGSIDLRNEAQKYVSVTRDVTIDLAGNTLTANGTTIRNAGYNLTIVDTVGGGKVVSVGGAAVGFGIDNTKQIVNGGSITINSGIFESCEGAVIFGLSKNAMITINGGTFSASDNAVVAGNGTSGCGNNTLVITGGTFNGGITSAGYIACGIYWPCSGTVSVTGGTFNITGGCGIAARAGTVTVDGATFACTGTAEGSVGDKSVALPSAVFVFDSTRPDYPGRTEADGIKIVSGSFSSEVATVAVPGLRNDILVAETIADAVTTLEGFELIDSDVEGFKKVAEAEEEPKLPTVVDGDDEAVEVEEDDDGNVVVKAEDTVTEITVSAPVDFDKSIVVPSTVTKVNGVADAKIVVMGGNVNITALLNIANGVIGDIKADVQTAIKAAIETVAVAQDILDDDETVAIPATPGLVYTMVEGKELNGMADGDSERASAGATSVNLKKTKFKDSGFYRIRVSK